jgi:peptidoglycan/xylan/chitin deacetylase (PgdA/CDA1 family)
MTNSLIVNRLRARSVAGMIRGVSPSGLLAWWDCYDPTAALTSLLDSTGVYTLEFGAGGAAPAWAAGGNGIVFVTNDYLTSTAPLALSSDFTVIACGLFNGSSGRIVELSYSGTQYQAITHNGSGQLQGKTSASTSTQTANLAVSTQIPNVVALRNTAATLGLHRPDTNTTRTVASKQSPYTGTLNVGRKSDGSTIVSAMTLYGLGLWNRSLQEDEVHHVGHYLDDLWTTRGVTEIPSAVGTPLALLTFDGGNVNTYNVAYPILAAAGLKATVYVISGLIGTEGYMTESQLAELYAAGWDLGNHTDNHVNLTSYGNAADVATHVGACTSVLDAHGWTRASKHVAYPGGASDATVTAGMALAGMLTGRTNTSGYPLPRMADAYALTTSIVANNPSAAWATGRVDTAFGEGAAALFTLHGLVDSPSIPEEWQPDRFQTLVNYLGTVGAEVLTISEWYARFA